MKRVVAVLVVALGLVVFTAAPVAYADSPMHMRFNPTAVLDPGQVVDAREPTLWLGV